MSNVSSNRSALGSSGLRPDDHTPSPRPSQDRPGRTQSARIQKRRTSAAVQQATHNRSVSGGSLGQGATSVHASPAPAPEVAQGPTSATPPARAARRSSLRSAVRRIFGRRNTGQENSQPSSIQNTPQGSPLTTTIRHSHATSDVGGLHAIPEQPAAIQPTSAVPSRAELPDESMRATSVDLPDNHSARNVRSPYAVEFPRSARLKPLDLGNPFHKSHGDLKRRATLPSVVIDKDEAAALAQAIRVPERYTPTPEEMERPRTAIADEGIGVAVTTSAMRKQHRRSRSADDLRRMALSLNPPRPRRDEIQYWRQSIAGTLPRRVVPVIINDGDDRQSRPVSPIIGLAEDPFVVATSEARKSLDVSPIVDNDELELTRIETTTETGATDLESRVLRLETGLASFQGALERLTQQQNRRTEGDGSPPYRSRRNTPSVLVNSLLDADHRYSTYSAAGRDAYTTDPSLDVGANAAAVPLTPRQGYSPLSLNQNRNFSRLHTMIDQERHARRTLEDQVRELQQSMMDMQDQLSRPIMSFPATYRRSQVTSAQHYSRPSGEMPSSTVGTAIANAGEYNDRSQLEAPNARLTSRFSMSESLTDSEAARLRSARTSDSDALRSHDDLHASNDDRVRQHQHQHPGTIEGGMF